MTACIIGWSHTPFGKHEGKDSEALIAEVATQAVADAGLADTVRTVGRGETVDLHGWAGLGVGTSQP